MTKSGRQLELVLNSALGIEGITENGQKTKLLNHGTLGDEVDAWSVPIKIKYIDKAGLHDIITRRRRTFVANDINGEEFSFGIIALWGLNGVVWIGPTECKIAELRDLIICVDTDPSNFNLKTLVFDGIRWRVVMLHFAFDRIIPQWCDSELLPTARKNSSTRLLSDRRKGQED